MIWDPRDTGDDDKDDEHIPDILWIIGAVLWFLLGASLLIQCSRADAATIPPFEVTLPTGQRIDACGIEYDARAKTMTLAPCVIVFADSFEAHT